MVAESIARGVGAYLGALVRAGVPVEYGVLFGSQARGDARPSSDIDLVVVSSWYDTHRDFDDVARLWIVKADHDWRIEPIACGLREWTEDDSRPILEIARREGVIIRPMDATA